MGTQSHETMAMEAAMAQRAVHATEQAAATSSDIAAEGTKISDATNWAMNKAKDTFPLGCGIRSRASDDDPGDLYQGGSLAGDPDRRWHWCGVDGTSCDDGAVRSTDGETECSGISRQSNPRFSASTSPSRMTYGYGPNGLAALPGNSGMPWAP
jgi:hypothetical protein